MGYRISCDRALHFTKMSVRLVCTWPPPKTATKRETTVYTIAWCISFLSGLGLLFPLIASMYIYQSNSFIVTQSACFIGAVTNFLFKMIVYRIHIKRTQDLIFEMENFMEKAQSHEKIVLEGYVDRCWSFHAFISVMIYVATATVVAVPLVNSEQPFPTSAVYPFSIDAGITMYLVFIHQTIAGFQCSSGITIDCQAAIILWFAGARLEILAAELKDVSTVKEFETFVLKHRKLLAYAMEASDTMSYVAFASSASCGIIAIMSSLQIFGDQPPAVKMQFGPVALISTINLFICAWPAQNLINACDLIGTSVYNVPWVDMKVPEMKNFLFLLGRCQRAVIVSVAGFLPVLSLRSYASFFSAIFSYFTTLRLAITTTE